MTELDAVKVLIIDDQQASCLLAKKMISQIFEQLDLGTILFKEAHTIFAGINSLQAEAFHLIILDKDLGQDELGKAIKGTDYITDLLAIRPLAKLLVMTADKSPTDIGRAIKSGATDYLFKGTNEEDVEYREAILARALKQAKDDLELATKKLNPVDTSLYGEFVASSPAMFRLKQTCEAYAESNRPILLLGDTGLGKGAAARLLHGLRAKYLGQKNRLFLNINIGALSEEIAQSEIFGHSPNSFTGAGSKVKHGFLEIGSDGDIFLDEIGDASPEIQLKLLKVIEERKYSRLGDTAVLHTNARFIFATNKNLNELVKRGKFRADLLARISTLEIQMPPLEERKEDLPEIVKFLIERANVEHRDRKLLYASFPKELINHLCRNNIEGNIRGIENEIIRLALGSPKQKNGFVDVSEWQRVLQPKTNYKNSDMVLTLESLKKMPTHFLKDGFPGLKKIRNILERRLLEEALEGSTSLNDVAKKLKITAPAVHQKLQVARLKIKK